MLGFVMSLSLLYCNLFLVTIFWDCAFHCVIVDMMHIYICISLFSDSPLCTYVGIYTLNRIYGSMQDKTVGRVTPTNAGVSFLKPNDN